MPSEFPILAFTNELEDAGWLGLAAASALMLFKVQGTGPGSLISTDEGFVWTKNLFDPATEKEIDLGIGKLKMIGAELSVSLGVQIKNGIPSYIDIMISFLGEGVAPSIFLEIDKKVAILADKILQGPTVVPPPPGEVVIGYENAGDPLRIPFPNGAIEFNFRFDKKKGVSSSLQLYGGFGGILQAAAGIIDFDLDRVIVFPELGGLGLYVDRLFIDFSDSGTTGFSGLFPEAYDASWKGFGAADVTFLYPVDEEKKEFINAGVKGFIFGFDDKFSASFNFNYINPDPEARIRYTNAEIEIRNNEFLRSEMHLGFDLKRALEKVDPGSADTGSIDTGGTDAEKHMAGEARAKLDDERPNFNIGGILDARVDFVWHRIDNNEILGFDIIMEGVSVNGVPSGFVISGNAAKMLFWIAGVGFGVSLLRKGIDEDNDFKKVVAISLLLLVVSDMIAPSFEGTPVLPQLEKLTIQKLGFRYVQIRPEVGPVEKYYDIITGWRIDFTVNSLVIKALEGLASFIFGSLGLAGNLFGETLDKIRIRGHIDIEIDNLTFSNKDLPQEIKTIFEQRDLYVRPKRLPEFLFEEEPGSSSSFPKPMGSAELVTRPIGTTTQQQYGIGIKLEGLASADFSIQFPAAGIVIFFYPDAGFEILPQTTILPKFTFVIPRALFAEGLIDLDKPLPSFGGSQNHIKLEVGAVYTSKKAEMKEYLKISNYKYKLGGAVVWGDATSNKTEPAREFGFLFIEVHYDGSTPLIVWGPLGIYGLGLLFGKNIRPGVQGGDNSAMGITNWIIGKREEGVDDKEIFKNVRNWPAIPAADGSTWHPSIHFDAENNTYDDLYSIGLTVKGGSIADEGATFMGEAITLVGVPEFWIALGGIVTFRRINSELIAIVVFDRDSLAVKIIYEVKKDKEGSFVRGIFPLEFGKTFSNPKRTWLYLGHYLDAKGGPMLIKFLKGLFTVKAYIDYDTIGLQKFGIVPVGDFPRPNITGGAMGFGLMLQWGPKKFGPKSVNITLFGALGLNVAMGNDPNITFGEIFIGGYIQLKVLFVKAKLELLLLLGGLTTDDGHRYLGLFMVRLKMPWPIPDWKYKTDFIIQSAGFLPLPDPVVSSTAAGLYRMEATALDLLTATPVVLPIDAAISITFDKPIYGIISGPGGSEDATSLLLNDENPENDKTSEILQTDYQGLKYIVHFTHVIEIISLRQRRLDSNISVVITEVPASWEAPALYKEGEPDPDAESHHTLFLNSLMPPHLQFSGEQLGEFNSWVETRDHIFPCEYPGLYCVNREPRPVLQPSPFPSIVFNTPYGNVDIRDDGISEEETGEEDYSGQLGWTISSPFLISLPYKTHYDIPFPDRVNLNFIWMGEGAGKLKNLITELKMEIRIKLRGAIDPVFFNLSLRIDNTNRCSWTAMLTSLDAGPGLLTVTLASSQCIDSNLVYTIEIISSDALHPIDFIKSKGFIPVFTPALMDGSLQALTSISEVYSILSNYRLFLSDLCLENTHHSSLHWSVTTIGSEGEGGNAVDTLTDHLLLQPASEYTVNCLLRSFVSTYHVGDDGTELVSEKELTIPLAPVRFHTESTPSQNIRQYIGFTYPAEGMQSPYASSLAPMLTFKYQGLILKIYKKYYGTDALIPLLADINGQELQPVLKEVIDLNSGGADQALEDLLQHCLEEARVYTHLQLSVWERSLQPDTRYSLQLKDIHVAESPTVPYTISFKTSRFEDLTTQIQYIQDLFEEVVTEPLLSPESFDTDMQTFLNAILSGEQPGFDDAVEKFYLNFLGVESGKLSPSPDQDYVSFIAGMDENGQPLTLGIVIELTEPILGKEGVSTDLLPAFPGPEKGVYNNGGGLLLLRDVSGSRLLLFKRDTSSAFISFTGTASLEFQFDPQTALLDSIAQYVRATFTDKDEAEQVSLVSGQFTQLLGFPGITEAMAVVSGTLEIIIPEAL
jgi:hypothetical protein